jgi:hypothetical protein
LTKNNVIRNVTDKYKRWQNITILTVNTAMNEEERRWIITLG